MNPRRDKPSGSDWSPEGFARLGPDRRLSRAEFLDLSRTYLGMLRESLAGSQRDGRSGRSLVADYTRIVDALVGVLFQRACDESGVTTDRSGVAIIGVGGYGRLELAPFSDVDIIVLCRRKTPTLKEVASTFVQLMWDVGFELGHAVHSLIESESTLSRHMDTRTALFESRWVCGARRVAREVERRIARLRRRDQEAFLRRKVADALGRHEKYKHRYQLIEPHVKLSPGGLRDYQTLVWMGMVMRGRGGLTPLARKGLLLAGESSALERAYDFLLRVRVELHLATRSKQDQLTVAMQKQVAAGLGYKDRGGHLGVELFMKDYYTHTRTIFQITHDILEDLEHGGGVGLLLGRRRVPRAQDRLRVRLHRARFQREPLYPFFMQKAAGKRFARSVKRRLSDVLEAAHADRGIRRRLHRDFPALLTGANITLVLRSMHETGFLGAIVPEYNELTSLKRYDLYHHYTVDEHSFQVVRNLERLRETGRPDDPLTRLYSEIADERVLYLTALLHDIGKIEGRGHARKGAVLARRILARMDVKNDIIEQVAYLIEIHLLMSHFSQRRDAADIGTLQAFCRKVKTRANLKYLCLLTYADLKATSPLVWTAWKYDLLWALYVQAYQFMARKEKQPEDVYKSRKQRLLRGFRSAAERRRALEHIDKLPGRYLLTMTTAHVRNHLELVDALGNERVVMSKRDGQTSTEITFCTHDKPYRLSQLCAVLTLNDCNILHANAFTRVDGKVLDLFQVEDLSGTRAIDQERMEQIRSDLLEILRGRVDVPDAVARHRARWKRRADNSIPVPLRIEFDNDTSTDVTIIDIHAPDEPGLLFTIAHALSVEGLVIHRARISTEANRAIDSFDVHDGRGGKVTGAARLRSIRARLERAISSNGVVG